MAGKWPLPRRAPSGLPVCCHPGCREPASYGYGCTLRSFGRHYCGQHRPDAPEPQAARPDGSREEQA